MSHDSLYAVIPHLLLRRIPDAGDMISEGQLFCMRIERTADARLYATGLFNQREYGSQTATMQRFRENVKQPSTINLVFTDVPRHIHQRFTEQIEAIRIKDLCPYGKWFGDNPTAPFLQQESGGTVPPDRRPKIQADHNKFSFFDIAEYTVQLGYGFIAQHAYEMARRLSTRYEAAPMKTPKASAQTEIDQTQPSRVIAANHDLYNHAEAKQELWDILFCNDATKVTKVDLYRTVDREHATGTLSTTSTQSKWSRTMVFLVYLLHLTLQGPPGTGKPYIMQRILLSFFQSQNKVTGSAHQVLIVSPTNELASRVASETQLVIEKYSRRQDASPAIVVRLYQDTTEWKLTWRPAAESEQDTMSRKLSSRMKAVTRSKGFRTRLFRCTAT